MPHYFYRVYITDRNNQFLDMGDQMHMPLGAGTLVELDAGNGPEKFRIHRIDFNATEPGDDRKRIDMWVSTWDVPEPKPPAPDEEEIASQLHLMSESNANFTVDLMGNNMFVAREIGAGGEPGRRWFGRWHGPGTVSTSPEAGPMSAEGELIYQRLAKDFTAKLILAEDSGIDEVHLMNMDDEPLLFWATRMDGTIERDTAEGMLAPWHALSDLLGLSGWMAIKRQRGGDGPVEIVAVRRGSARDHSFLR